MACHARCMASMHLMSRGAQVKHAPAALRAGSDAPGVSAAASSLFAVPAKRSIGFSCSVHLASGHMTSYQNNPSMHPLPPVAAASFFFLPLLLDFFTPSAASFDFVDLRARTAPSAVLVDASAAGKAWVAKERCKRRRQQWAGWVERARPTRGRAMKLNEPSMPATLEDSCIDDAHNTMYSLVVPLHRSPVDAAFDCCFTLFYYDVVHMSHAYPKRNVCHRNRTSFQGPCCKTFCTVLCGVLHSCLVHVGS